MAKPSRSDASTGGEAEERSALDAGAAGARRKEGRRPGGCGRSVTWRSSEDWSVPTRPSQVHQLWLVVVIARRHNGKTLI